MHHFHLMGIKDQRTNGPVNAHLISWPSKAQNIQNLENKLKQCFLGKTMSPQPSSFNVGYIENYGIKLWRPFKQQYSIGRNGHRLKWLWAEMVMDQNGYGQK